VRATIPDPAAGRTSTDHARSRVAILGRTTPVSVLGRTEVELKYRLADRKSGERLISRKSLGPLRAQGEIDEVHHDDSYVDTPDRALRRAGYAARIRQTQGGPILGLKALAGSGTAVHRREELESPGGSGLQPLAWPPSDARSVILELSGDAALVETVRLDQKRRKRRFGNAGTTVEVSLDDVRVMQGETEIDRFLELEVEVVDGDESPLEQVAETLARATGVTPSPDSKLATAERAVADAPAFGHAQRIELPSPGKHPGVTAEDTLASAGRKVMRFHLARMLARETGTRSGKDPEDVHAMRVATRRLRAAWRVFGDAFRRREARELRRSLRRVADKLGGVRDLDVLIDAGEQYARDLPGSRGEALAPLFDSWRQKRNDARTDLIAELESARYRRFVDAFLAFVADDAGDAPVSADAPHLVRDTAPARLWAGYHSVRAYQPLIRWADIGTLHALRIDAKRFRYGLEFFGETLGRDGEKLVAKIVALQDHLGKLHDADVAAGLTREFLVEHATRLEAAHREEIARYLAHEQREIARLRKSTNRPWADVDDVAFRRALGRALARL
jgi:triphosphatase